MSAPVQQQLEIPESYSNLDQDKIRVVKTVKDYLNKVELTRGRGNKKKLCDELFDFLIDNSWFIRNNRRFAGAVYKKLLEFEEEEDWDEIAYYKLKLFPTGCPQLE